ncbi:hypothetical protein QTV44_002494 [Vibrio vulnificus]|nr:hypothetical protein [Vibrio vulnificus]
MHHETQTCHNCHARLTKADISSLIKDAKRYNVELTEIALLCNYCQGVKSHHQAQCQFDDEGCYESAESFARDWAVQ